MYLNSESSPSTNQNYSNARDTEIPIQDESNQNGAQSSSSFAIESEILEKKTPPTSRPLLVVVKKLPQNFECKYMGKIRCDGIWGLKHLRQAVERLVQKTKQKRSLDELANFEVLISEKGINVVQRVKSVKGRLTFKSGLLPADNISYAAQDPIYKKIFSCILVRERASETISECFSFLCRNTDTAKKMALSLTLAFNELSSKSADANQRLIYSEKVYNDSDEDYSCV